MLMKFKVICVSRKTAAGDESFQIWQLRLNQNRMKASQAAASFHIQNVNGPQGQEMSDDEDASTDITASLIKGQESQPRSYGLNSHQIVGFKFHHF